MNTSNERTPTGAAINPEAIVLALAAARALIGVRLLVAPRTAAPVFGRELIDLPAGRFASRALGTRDLALGLGVLIAYRRGRPLRGWAEAGATVDALDGLTAAVAGRGLPWLGRLAFGLGGAVFAVVGLAAAAQLGEPVEVEDEEVP
jgi:hypothetical protein